MPDPIKSDASAPAVAAFAPKVGTYAILSEDLPKNGGITTYLFLVTEVGSAQQVKRDAKGNVVLTDKTFPVGEGQSVVRKVAVTEQINTSRGFAFNAQQASSSPRRNVLPSSLSPLS